MNKQNGKFALKNFWIIFPKIAEYIAIASFLAFFCLKIELLTRLPDLANMLFSEAMQTTLKNIDANYFLAVALLGFVFSPYAKNEIIEPLSAYSFKDLAVSTIAAFYFAGALLLSSWYKRYTAEEWQKVFGPYRFLNFLLSFACVKNNVLPILVGTCLLLGLVWFSFSSFFKNIFYQPMAKSFRELRFFSWPKLPLVFRFSVAICIFTLLIAMLIAILDWLALRLMTFVLSWTA